MRPILLVWLLGCEDEPYTHCTRVEGAGCDPLKTCCQESEDGPIAEPNCWIETEGGGVFECDGSVCSTAIEHAICRACDDLADDPSCKLPDREHP